jgi:hypothetical protein
VVPGSKPVIYVHMLVCRLWSLRSVCSACKGSKCLGRGFQAFPSSYKRGVPWGEASVHRAGKADPEQNGWNSFFVWSLQKHH